MKVLILYKSKAGSTKQYAEWLHQAIKESVIYDLGEFNIDDISHYDLIIIGSRTYMGRIDAQKFIVKNWAALKERRVFLFSVGLLPQEEEASRQAYELIPKEIRAKLLGYEKLPGRLDFESLNLLDKTISKLLGTKQSDNVKKSEIMRILEKIR